MDVCPPFRALIYSRFIPWYNAAVRDYVAGEKLNAGSNDLFMKRGVRHCDRFVTNDIGQEKSLREVALATGLENAKFCRDHDFCNSFLVTI